MTTTADGLFFSDAHMRDRPDERYALAQVVDAALTHEVQYVVGAGDLLDQQTNRAAAVAFFYRQVTRLHEAGVYFYYVEGQHELDTVPWLSGHPWPIHLHRNQVLQGRSGLTIAGLNFRPHAELAPALAEVSPGVDLLVCHQGWSEWLRFPGAAQGSFTQIPAHVRRLYTGDYHRCRQETHTNAGGHPLAVLSTGALCRQEVVEPAEHYYAILDSAGVFHRHKIRSRPALASPVLNTAEELEAYLGAVVGEVEAATDRAAAAGVPEEIRRPTLRLCYNHDLREALRRVRRAVGDRVVLYPAEMPPERQQQAARAAAADGIATTTLTALAAEVDQKERPEVYDLVYRLLTAQDKASEFERWHREFH